MVRNRIKALLSGTATVIELLVAVMIILTVLLASISMAFDLFEYGLGVFSDDAGESIFSEIFEMAIHIVIGIEMVKMIVKHTPASVLEVLLFVIAKRVVAESNFRSIDILICVVAIAVVFAIKKFLHFDNVLYRDGYVYSADSKVSEIETLLRINLPNGIGETIGEIVSGEFARLEKPVAVGEVLNFCDAVFRVHSVEDGQPKKIEIIVKKKSK